MARILLVDDDPGIRQWLTTLLEREGHAVREAADGKEAEVMIGADRPDVVILDILMPVQEGLETIVNLRRNHHDIKILAISGGGMRQFDFLRTAQRFGADATLSKPFRREALLAVLEPLLPASLE